ncbi:hypothetical protein LR393_27630 [Kineosporia mesophila]|nr:hypothetical protein [Kineosporia mesophila]MCD5353851.1 hypothetical protein [Kineosporia mesophila]
MASTLRTTSAPVPGVAVSTYPVIGAPPVWVGALQLAANRASPGEAESPDGAAATVDGVDVTADDAGPLPAELVAVTVMEYAVPLLRPVREPVVPVTFVVRAAWPGAL